MSEIPSYPNSFGHHYLKAMEEVLGTTGRNTVLHLAKHSDLIISPPQDNDIRAFGVSTFADLNIAYLSYFGRLGGSGLAYRCGQAAWTHLHRALTKNALTRQQADTLPLDQLIHRLLAPLIVPDTGITITVQTSSSHIDVMFNTCPACLGYTSEMLPLRQGEPDPMPVCKGIVGWLYEGLLWARSREHIVEEIACRASQPVANCIFRVTSPFNET